MGGSRSIRQNRSRRCSTSSNLSIQDKQEYVRFSTSTALLRIGTPGAIKAIIEICPGLIRVLQDQKWNIRAAVTDTLGQIGEGAEDAVPALIRVLQDNNQDVRHTTVGAQEKVGTPEAIREIKDFQQQNSDYFD